MPFSSNKHHFFKTGLSTAVSVFFLFQTLCSQTETIDSLKNILPLLKDSARIDCLNELGFEYSNHYWNKSNYVQTDTALIYSRQAHKEAIQLHYNSGIGKALQNFGMVEEQRGNYNSFHNKFVSE